ncbi:helix-turn-helix domain-containing protein [Limimaricola cinnabarinus]|uniref:helix-turn-helix domain-containing protein n=1 Tax=Limimaricola cinnabarinus TaxID=1125964 RepID=UPI002493B8AB|nr:helix-turn-helix transcriptional regulator [Limimaricola cinnabarinus]
MDVMQCRAARAMLSLGVRELAALAGVSPDTVARLERGATLKPVTVERIQAALEARGIVFLDPGDRAPGPGLSLDAPSGQGRAVD